MMLHGFLDELSKESGLNPLKWINKAVKKKISQAGDVFLGESLKKLKVIQEDLNKKFHRTAKMHAELFPENFSKKVRLGVHPGVIIGAGFVGGLGMEGAKLMGEMVTQRVKPTLDRIVPGMPEDPKTKKAY